MPIGQPLRVRDVVLGFGAFLLLGPGIAGTLRADDPAAPESLEFANRLLRDRRYDLAAEEFARLLKAALPPREAAEAHFGLGRAFLFQQKFAGARTEFEEFLRLAPDHPGARPPCSGWASPRI